MDELLERLRQFDALRDIPGGERVDKVFRHVLPRREPEFAPAEYLSKFSPLIRKALAALDITRLYAHQAEAIDIIRAGKDVVLEAPTASGKTLCFNIPLIERLMENSHARALMIHPMKALSNDQRRQLESLATVLGNYGGRKLETWIYDGDTEQEHRDLIRQSPPAVLLTNPEMLHLSFLGWNEKWERFLKGICLLIIDEIHEYRGYFGTNVALLFRRFLAKLHQLGSHPQVVLATATCGNAEEHAYRLTGRRCTLVRARTAICPERHFAFIEPAIPDYHFHDIYRLRIVRATLACLSQGLSTLVFCPSRQFAEETAMQAKKEACGVGISPEVIAPYRAGYEAELRRDIENGLRTGQFQAVFSTNALEIGIDIGRLDACILAGFPDNVLSAWQRIGRIGRNWEKKAYILFYAFNNPFDRFFANNIQTFLEKPLDEIFIGVDNEELMRKHLPYLVHETNGQLGEDLREHLGSAFLEFARKEAAGTKPLRGRKPPYNRLSIRGIGGTTYRLVYRDREIGSISDVHLFREAYVGAIYSHFGKPYRVIAHGADEVHLDDVEPYLRTEGIFYTVVQNAEIIVGKRYRGTVSTCYGRLVMFENFAGYRVIDSRTGEVVDEQRSQLARSATVRGFWLEIERSVFEERENMDDLFGVEQLLRVGAPFVVPCDRHDIGTLTSSKTLPSVYLYETVPGGIGVAEKVLELWREILRTGMDIAEKCPCKHGCPSCLVPPRLPPDISEPKKAPAIRLANFLLENCRTEAEEIFDPDVYVWREIR